VLDVGAVVRYSHGLKIWDGTSFQARKLETTFDSTFERIGLSIHHIPLGPDVANVEIQRIERFRERIIQNY
jgi:hypothetical protein